MLEHPRALKQLPGHEGDSGKGWQVRAMRKDRQGIPAALALCSMTYTGNTWQTAKRDSKDKVGAK